ncbi:MAG: hypothetical protein ABIM99_01910 [Candidatus Dojkabacteria bacterium]
MKELITDFLDPKWDLVSIDQIAPKTEEKVEIMKDNFTSASDMYFQQILTICKHNKEFNKYWSVIWHDVRNQFNQISGNLELAFYGINSKNGIAIFDIIKSEIKALRGVVHILDKEYENPNSKFTFSELLDSVFIPNCILGLKGKTDVEFDISVLFSIRTMILNAKGKSSKVAPSKVIIEPSVNEKDTAFKIFDNATPTWPKSEIAHWAASYTKGWEAFKEVTEATNGGGSIIAYTQGQKARLNGNTSVMDANSLLRYIDGKIDGTDEEFKYVELVYPKVYSQIEKGLLKEKEA